MSIAVSVLSDRGLTQTEEWQRALDAEGFPLRLDGTVILSEARGFLPALLREKQTGFECYHDDAAEFLETYSDTDFGRSWKCALGLRIGGDYSGLRAAFMAATAYARATGGVVWDSESGEVMSPDRAAEVTREIDATSPEE